MAKLFKELSKELQNKVAQDYVEGWEETHEYGDLPFEIAFDLCMDDETILYTEKGEIYDADN